MTLPKASTPHSQKRRNLFGGGFDCEEDFPEGCLKAHPLNGVDGFESSAPLRPQAVLTTPKSRTSGSVHGKGSEAHADEIETIGLQPDAHDAQKPELSI